jgi:hypothetical protein
MSDLKPIATIYRGYRFRSRLEARWAVFFDAASIKFEYDLEDHRLPSTSVYLHDFYLTDLGLYVEVQPAANLDPKILKKGLEFALEGDNQLLLVVGSPTQESMFLVNRCTCSHWEEYVAEFEGNVSEEDVLQVVLEGLRSSGAVQFSTTPLARGFTLSYRSLPPYDHHRLQEAFFKANQARFGAGSE